MIRFIIIFLLFLFSNKVFADEIKPLLWEARKYDKLIYFIGITPIIQDNIKLSEDVNNIILNSDTIVFETDISHLSKEDYARLIYLPDNENLQAYLSSKNWIELTRLTKSKNYSSYITGKLKPWYISNILSIPKISINNIENTIKELAIKNNKSILLMEKPEEQLSLFDKVPINENISMLNEIIEDIDKIHNSVLFINQKYLERDLEAIENIIFSEEKISKYPEYYRILFFDRNLYWISKIENMTSNDKNFVFILSINNLLGNNGILKKLQNMDYNVKLID